MMCFVYIELADDENGHGASLTDAWVYWREGQSLMLLRTDGAGMLLEMRPGGHPSNPFDYEAPFLGQLDAQVAIGYSRFALPLPEGFLDDHPESFANRTLQLEDDDGDAHDAFPEPNLPDRPPEISAEDILAALTSTGGHADIRTVLSDQGRFFASGDPLDESGARAASGLIAQRAPQPAPRRPRRVRRHAPVAPHAPAPPAPPPPQPAQPVQPAPPAPTTNTLVPAPYVRIVLQDIRLEVTTPQELGIWVMLREPPSDSYLTEHLAHQGADLWTPDRGHHGGSLRVVEDAATPAARVAQPPERGLSVRGFVDARATSLKIGVQTAFRGASATALILLPDPTKTTTAKEIDATLGAPAGALRPFEASIFFQDASAAFGLVALTFSAVGTPAPLIESLICQLAGVQIAIVNDHDAAADGKTPGPQTTEADEHLVIDFTVSPEPTRPEIQARTRQRRMIRYPLAVRERTTTATPPTLIQKPEMPLWMVELSLLGIAQEGLESLLVLRHLFHFQAPTRSRLLAFNFSFRIHLAWDGVDWGTHDEPASRAHQTLHNLDSSPQQIVLGLARDPASRSLLAQPLAVTAKGLPPPQQLDLPVAGRRKAAVVFDERGWGRAAAAARVPAMILEWQPNYTRIDARGHVHEIVRGGDGTLTLQHVAIGGVDVDPGIDRATLARAASNEQRLPTFRLPGRNPVADAAHLDPITNFLVEEFHRAHAADVWIQLLHLETWKATLRLLINHESRGMHFRVAGAPIVSTPTALIRFESRTFGHQHDMPLFGPPHGYGIAQLDNPKPTDDQVWSFFENIRAAVELTMGPKAHQAFTALSANLPANQLGRSVFQRDIVRRYNGGTEFQWNGHRFEIHPSLAQWQDRGHTQPNQRLPYPSQVLGTGHIHYWTGAGAAATFPWPIAFGINAADFGPETNRTP